MIDANINKVGSYLITTEIAYIPGSVYSTLLLLRMHFSKRCSLMQNCQEQLSSLVLMNLQAILSSAIKIHALTIETSINHQATSFPVHTYILVYTYMQIICV